MKYYVASFIDLGKGHDKRSTERALIGFALEHFKSDERHERSEYFDTSLLSLSSTL